MKIAVWILSIIVLLLFALLVADIGSISNGRVEFISSRNGNHISISKSNIIVVYESDTTISNPVTAITLKTNEVYEVREPYKAVISKVYKLF